MPQRVVVLAPIALFALFALVAPSSGCSATAVELRETRPILVRARPPAPPPASRVHVSDTELRADEKIYFETDSARIRGESFGILDEIAATIQAHPAVERLRVEGHTDHVGGATYNRRLSQDRAQAVVDYLVGHGVDAGRLEAEGFGFARPIASNDDESGRSQNRRVEFRIVQLSPVGPQASR